MSGFMPQVWKNTRCYIQNCDVKDVAENGTEFFWGRPEQI